MSENKPSNRILELEESQTIAMAKASRALKAKGIDVVNLSFGEPNFKTPAHIREAAKAFIDEGYVYYTPVAGDADLRKAVSEKFKRENNLNFSPEQVVVSTGAKHSIINVLLSLVNPGDEVVIPTPYWVSYSEMVKLAEGKTVYIETTVEQDFKISPEMLRRAISPKSKVFLFSTPCNPTGSVYSRQELEALAKVFEENPQIFIISDEIYEHINFDGTHFSLAQIESLQNRVVVVNGVSKAFAMTGWRVGYIGAPLWIAQACEKLQSQFTSGTNAVAQKAAIAALRSPLQSTYQMKEIFRKRRDMVLAAMKEIPGIKLNKPEGAFYVFPDVSSFFGKKYKEYFIRNSDDLCMFLLNEAHVAIVPGSAFGAEGYVRFSYAASEEDLTKAMARLKETLDLLN